MSKHKILRFLMAATIGVPAALLFMEATNWKAMVALCLCLWANNIGLPFHDD